MVSTRILTFAASATLVACWLVACGGDVIGDQEVVGAGGSAKGVGGFGDDAGVGGSLDGGVGMDGGAGGGEAAGGGASDAQDSNAAEDADGPLTCTQTLADCDGLAANGCEVNLGSDPENCGWCGKPCPASSGCVCSAGTCKLSCPSGMTVCPGGACGTCANLATDPNNCGACGEVCTFAHGAGICLAASCLLGSCDSGFADCDLDPLTGCEVAGGGGCVCVPATASSCYTGPPGTEGVGRCVGGVQTCDAQGMSLGPCLGELLPVLETCATPLDDDCDGQTNEGGEGCCQAAPVCGPIHFAKSFGAFGDEYARAVAVHPDGSFVVVGRFHGQVKFGSGEANETMLVGSGDDGFVAQYNPDGTLVWAKRFGGISWEEARAVATTSDHGVVVVGLYHDAATFGPGETGETVLTGAGTSSTSQMFVARYHADGTLDWVRGAGGALLSGIDSWGVAAGLGDEVTVIGEFSETVTFGAGELHATTLTALGAGGSVYPGPSDVFVARYSPVDGSLLWVRRAGGLHYESGEAIASTSDGGAVVTGTFDESATFGVGEPGETTIGNGSGGGPFVARYTAAGDLAWVRAASPPLGKLGTGHGIGVRADSTIIVAGSVNPGVVFGVGEPNETVITGGNTNKPFVASYGPDGTFGWVRTATSTSMGLGLHLALDACGNIALSGRFTGNLTFGSGEGGEATLVSAGWWDMFLATFDATGTFVCARHAGGPLQEPSGGVAFTPDRGIIVVSSFSGQVTFGAGDPNETVLQSTGSNRDGFTTKYGP